MQFRAAVLAGLILAPIGASAQSVTDAKPQVAWSDEWPRFRSWEFAGSAVLGAASLYLYRYQPPPAQPRWQGHNAVDDTVRGWLVGGTRADRQRAARISDVLWLGGTAVPFAVELPVALLVHRQPDLTWQLLMIDLEVNAVAGFVNHGLFYVVGRGRPSQSSCAVDPGTL